MSADRDELETAYITNRIFLKFIYKEVYYVHENGLALVW